MLAEQFNKLSDPRLDRTGHGVLAGSKFGDALVERALLHDNETQSQVEDDRREKLGRGGKGEHHRSRSLVHVLPDHDSERSECDRTEDGADIEVFSLAFALLFLDEGERRRQNGREGKQVPPGSLPASTETTPATAEMAAPNPNRTSRSLSGRSRSAPAWRPTMGSWPLWGI